VRQAVRDLLDRSGVTQELGAESFHPRTVDGMLAYSAKHREAIGGAYAALTECVKSLMITVDTHVAQANGCERECLIAAKSRLESLAHEIGAQSIKAYRLNPWAKG
jgi:hypothetical protein